MKKYGFVASGGGFRSFYTGGVLVWLQRQGVPIVHLTSASSGNNIVLDYLLWDWEQEDLPPVLSKTHRLSFQDTFDVFSNFLGLQPPLIPNGSHLFTVNKARCRRSLMLDDPGRRELLEAHLKTVQWDIITSNLTERRSNLHRVNTLLPTVNNDTINSFLDVFIAGITTIPYFKAVMLDNVYHLEGGYTDNTPLRSLFENPDVDEIIAVDFTDYDYHQEIDRIYKKNALVFALNSIEMNLLVNNIQWGLPNKAILAQANRINKILEKIGQSSIEIEGKTYYHKPLHILNAQNLESMTVSLENMTIQKEYFNLGQQDIETMFDTIVGAED
ncbi:MAG: patatin-like phospholipase family protein [Anaerolineae bacterium]|nr:patatin-like phospholipase family protein [Anaerolineae bacterium]